MVHFPFYGKPDGYISDLNGIIYYFPRTPFQNAMEQGTLAYPWNAGLKLKDK